MSVAPRRRILSGSAASLGVLSLALVVTGCGEAPIVGPSADEANGALTGTLVGTTSDDLEGHSETRWAVRDAFGRETPLVLDALPAADWAVADPNVDVRVWGVPVGDSLRATRLERVTPQFEITRAPLRMATPKAPRSFAFVLLDMGGGVNTTADMVNGRLLTGADSIKNYYLADSYGVTDVTAQVFGPIKYAFASGCGTSQLAMDLRAMVPGTFQHYLWYMGSRQSACSWTGLASVGSPDRPSRDTWYNASTSCVVLVQEPGHNFGMQHSSSLACPGGATLADDVNTCTASEYGDPFDPMGGGCRHMNAWQKDYQGWFGGCNGVTVRSSGTFTLLPIEQRCDGVQFLKIAAPKTRMFNRPAAGGGGATVESFSYYYVELRTPQDFDGMLGNRSALTPQVLVHIGGDRRLSTQRGLHTFLLDMTPTTTGRAGVADSALAVGKSFNDPAGGLTITTVAVSATQATIKVDIPNGGANGSTCLDDSPFTAPGPGPESCGAMVPGTGGMGPDIGGTAGVTGEDPTGASGAPGGAGAGGRTGANGGATGAAGATGTAGVTGGPTGTAGSTEPPATGTSGATGAGGGEPPTNGAAGALGSTGGGTGSHLAPGPVTGAGCACATGGTSLGAWTWLAGAFALVLARRRRR
jgi:MYXO-CTERM domain-containing protein